MTDWGDAMIMPLLETDSEPVMAATLSVTPKITHDLPSYREVLSAQCLRPGCDAPVVCTHGDFSFCALDCDWVLG